MIKKLKTSTLDETVTMAGELMDDIFAEAQKKKASAVKEISVELGDLSACKSEALVNSLQLLAEGTIAENAKITVKAVEGVDCILKKIVIR
jgi:Zn finger protein HypA/HybF involved in hydrogenase expression